MEEIYIREAQPGDYIGIRTVDELTLRQELGLAWDRLSEDEQEAYLKSRRSEFELNLATGYCFVAVSAEKVVGFIFAHETVPFRDTLYIRHIAVHPDFQGSGIGSMLYKTLIEKATRKGIRKITALIDSDNSRSIKLHGKMGFEVVDRKQAFLVLR